MQLKAAMPDAGDYHFFNCPNPEPLILEMLTTRKPRGISTIPPRVLIHNPDMT